MGFQSRAEGPKVLRADHPAVKADDILAEEAQTLALQLLRHRACSMSWHDQLYPGLLALATSSDRAVQDDLLRSLQLDLAALQAAQKEASEGTFLARLARNSTLNQVL
eukprot:1634170-Alexandrium_andersonii.AAC.1